MSTWHHHNNVRSIYDDLVFVEKQFQLNDGPLMCTYTLMHQELPFAFTRQLHDNGNLMPSDINKAIKSLYNEVFMTYLTGKASLPILGRYQVIYFPEWDNDSQKWFIRNIDGVRVFEVNDLNPQPIVDPIEESGPIKSIVEYVRERKDEYIETLENKLNEITTGLRQQDNKD